MRDEEVLIAHGDTRIESGDHVLLFLVDKKYIRDVERLFQAGLTFLRHALSRTAIGFGLRTPGAACLLRNGRIPLFRAKPGRSRAQWPTSLEEGRMMIEGLEKMLAKGVDNALLRFGLGKATWTRATPNARRNTSSAA